MYYGQTEKYVALLAICIQHDLTYTHHKVFQLTTL